jgi:hypothetical protein
MPIRYAIDRINGRSTTHANGMARMWLDQFNGQERSS